MQRNQQPVSERLPLLPVTILVLCVAALWAHAAEAQEPWEAPAFSADPAELHKAVSALPVEDGTDVLIALDEVRLVFDADGKHHFTRRLVFRAVTAAGADDWARVQVRWEPWHEERPEIRARVITAGGSVHTLDSATIAESGTESNERDVFSDERVISGPLPAITAGAVVEEEFVTRETAPLFAGGVVHWVYLANSAPTQRSRLVIDAPASLPLRYKTLKLGGTEPRRTESNGRVELVFQAGPLPAWEEVEPYMPPEEPRWPVVVVSTGTTWQEVATRYSRVIDAQLQNAEVGKLLRDVVGKKKSHTEIAEAAVAWLHREIRYTGVEYGEASIVPRTPAETLQRKYGDCKDKAALLIALLRAAGLPAYLALLNTAASHETQPELPGLGAFDHAIVYVPGETGLWIDATAEFARVGQLPLADQGRLALVVRPETTRLIPTPESNPQENRAVETREVFLSEQGKARVVEVTETWGSVESGYRDYYADADPKEMRKQLEVYAKDAYLSEELKDFPHTEAHDFSRPFQLRLEMNQAARGTTDRADAAVGIPLKEIVSRLPDLEPKEEEKPKEGKETPARKRQSDLVLPEPFQIEWRYRIVPPPGFQARPLPENKTERWGAATLSQEFALAPDGVVTATFRFDTGKRRLTAAEAEALRAGVEEFRKRDVLLVNFDQVGEAHLAAGRIREALAEFRKLLELHPKEALHHMQVARALLEAGIGEAARAQARLATEVEPSSMWAHQTLGWVLQHDLVGRRFGKGFDGEGSAAAYRKALELEPDNVEVRADLAILLEHDAGGRRYGPRSRMDEAIAEYRKIEEKARGTRLENNLPVALMWAQRFPELAEAAQKLKNEAARHQFTLVARAAQQGPQAALQEAAQIPDTEPRRTALANAGTNLMHLRLYPQAVALLRAGAQGTPRAAAAEQLTAMLERVKRHEEADLSDSDPANVPRQLFILMLGSEASEQDLLELISRHSREQMAAEIEDLEKIRNVRASLRKDTSGLPLEVLLDLMLVILEMSVDGDEQAGYRVAMRAPSQEAERSDFAVYLVREDGRLRIFDFGDKDEGIMVGLFALERAEAGDLAGARRLLDWVRQDITLKADDDPLAGAPFPRFWERGQEADAEAIRYAAASLMLKEKPAARALPILREGRKLAVSDEARLRFDLAEAQALRNLKRYTELREVAARLLAAHPKSASAFQHMVAALAGLKQWGELEAAIQKRIELLPDDPDATRAQVDLAQGQGQWNQAAEASQRLARFSKATAQDLNGHAWNALFAGTASPEAVQTAQRATMMAKKQEKPGILHTVASLYAEIGKTTESRTILLQAMDLEGLEEPDGKSWYVFGRIAEQYGEYEAAAAAYRKVNKPKEDSPIATYHLAMRRLNLLAKERKIKGSP